MQRSVLITTVQRAQLLANGTRAVQGEDIDPSPVVKLFTPDAAATWLLTEIDAADPNRAFGLCDPGLGSPELGFVILSTKRRYPGRLTARCASRRSVDRSDLSSPSDRPDQDSRVARTDSMQACGKTRVPKRGRLPE